MGDREDKKPMATSSEILSWYVKSREIHIKLGPFGSTKGERWDDGSHERIESIFVSYSSTFVDSIITIYKDLSNDIFITPERGSRCVGSIIEAIHPPPETPITRIDGYYDEAGIRYLELSTNNGKMCSFSIKSGSPFMYKDPRGFTGFHGCSNSAGLIALGVYVNSSATKYLNP